MKVKKSIVEFYKWVPLWLSVLYIMNVYFYRPSQWLSVVHILFFFIAFVPFIFIHGVICRHIYTEHKAEKGGGYEL